MHTVLCMLPGRPPCPVCVTVPQETQAASSAATRPLLACNGKPGDDLARLGASLALRKPPLASSAAAAAAAATAVKVSTWDELLQAVEAASASSSDAQAPWVVFELLSNVTASSSLNLGPGMAVIGRQNSRQTRKGAGAGRVTIKCAAGVQTAITVKLLQGQRYKAHSELASQQCIASTAYVDGNRRRQIPGLHLCQCLAAAPPPTWPCHMSSA